MSDDQKPARITCTPEENAAFQYAAMQQEAAKAQLSAAQAQFESTKHRILLAHHREIGETPLDSLMLHADPQTGTWFFAVPETAPVVALPQPAPTRQRRRREAREEKPNPLKTALGQIMKEPEGIKGDFPGNGTGTLDEARKDPNLAGVVATEEKFAAARAAKEA